jgi:hypothetical protein
MVCVLVFVCAERPRKIRLDLKKVNATWSLWSIEVGNRGWLYGMEMDLYKSQFLDGVLVQKKNCTSRCLKLHASVSQFLGLNVHIPAYLGSRGKPFFETFKLFRMIGRNASGHGFSPRKRFF